MPTTRDNPRDPIPSVQRIIWAGVVWFATGMIAIAFFLGILLASGWRPNELALSLAITWWAGCALTAAGMVLIGWSGCPVLAEDAATENRRKAKTMPIGMVLFLIGTAGTVFAVLLS